MAPQAPSATQAAATRADDPPRVCLLGVPLIEHAGTRLVLAPERPMQMLAWLATQTDWTSRERLAALFWPEHTSEAARRNVRKLVHRAHALTSERGLPPLQEQAGSVRWPLATDVQAFEQAAAEGAVDAALALWRGEPWLGFDVGSQPFGDWVQFERLRLRARWRDLLLSGSGPEVQAAVALPRARALLDMDPLDEAALQRVMRCEREIGHGARAASAYSGYVQTLAQVHGLCPGTRTQALLQEDGPTPPQVASASAGRPATAPHETPFFGRTAEAQELKALLTQGARWITLVGPGGVGKSRLARELAPQLVQGTTAPAPAPASGPGLVWLSCEQHADAPQVWAALLAALGIAPRASETPAASLRRTLAQRRLLLVLDNLEHLRAAARDIGAALADCAGVQVLATSRMRLLLPQERLLLLHGLPAPAPEDADRAESFDAVRCFVRCAQAQDATFTLAAQREAVVALTAAVEGLPLALELAALAVRHLPVSAVVAELERGDADVLDAGEAAPDPRRRSVRVVFEHSWRLLVPAERALLARLALFQGGFSLEAARAVFGAPLPVLAALIDKSLVRVDDTRGAVAAAAGAPASARLSMHPLVQQFAAERLDPAERAAARDAHAQHHLQLLARYPRGRLGEQAAYFDRIDEDFANVRVAWLHAVERGWSAALAAGLVSLASFLFSRSRCDDGLALLEVAVPRLGDDASAVAESQVARALLLHTRSRYPEAAALARAALRHARQRKDARLRRSSLFMLGQASVAMGHYAAAAHCHRESLELARAEGNGNAIAGGLAMLGDLAIVDGRYDEAIDCARRSLEQQALNGVVHADTISALALALHRAGRHAEADEQFARARAQLSRREGGIQPASCAYNEALAAFERGDLVRAQACAERAREAVAMGGEPAHEAALPLLQSGIALRQNHHALALQHLQRGLGTARELHMQWLLLAGLVQGAQWLLEHGDAGRAAALLRTALGARGLRAADRHQARALLERTGAPAAATVAATASSADGAAATASVDDAVALLLALGADGAGSVAADVGVHHAVRVAG